MASTKKSSIVDEKTDGIAVSLAKPLLSKDESSEMAKDALTTTMTTNERIEWIDTIRTGMQELHDSGVNHTYEWRLDQLNRMDKMLSEHWYEFATALESDLGCCTMEAGMLHIETIRADLRIIRSTYLKQYTQPKRVPSPLWLIPAFTKLIPMPLLGPAVLVIGPSNYPLSMPLQPAMGALAAGNPVIIKPSEHSSATSAIMEKYVTEYFEPNAMRVVQGEVAETTALLERTWGKIVFTGSTMVGKIVASAAAQTLTPTLLELGGKCPCIVDPDTCNPNNTDLTLVANRILFAKFLNCGQTCIGVDTVFVSEEMLDALLPYLLDTLHKQYGDDDTMFDSTKSEMGRIVSKHAAQRLYQSIEEVEQYITKQAKDDTDDTSVPKCRMVLGGTKYCKIDEKFIAPTIVINPPQNCAIMKDEIFGPILAIITLPSRSDIIQYIRTTLHINTTPLAMYVFTKSDASYQQYISNIRCGAAMRNDCLVYAASTRIPFGGLGTSGCGTYHSCYSLESFTQWLPSMYRPLLPGTDLALIRYPPYKKGTFKHWFVLDIASKLPDVPNLYVPEVIALIIVSIVGMYIVSVVYS